MWHHNPQLRDDPSYPGSAAAPERRRLRRRGSPPSWPAFQPPFRACCIGRFRRRHARRNPTSTAQADPASTDDTRLHQRRVATRCAGGSAEPDAVGIIRIVVFGPPTAGVGSPRGWWACSTRWPLRATSRQRLWMIDRDGLLRGSAHSSDWPRRWPIRRPSSDSFGRTLRAGSDLLEWCVRCTHRADRTSTVAGAFDQAG